MRSGGEIPGRPGAPSAKKDHAAERRSPHPRLESGPPLRKMPPKTVLFEITELNDFGELRESFDVRGLAIGELARHICTRL